MLAETFDTLLNALSASTLVFIRNDIFDLPLSIDPSLSPCGLGSYLKPFRGFETR
jgi:hypothetical protein